MPTGAVLPIDLIDANYAKHVRDGLDYIKITNPLNGIIPVEVEMVVSGARLEYLSSGTHSDHAIGYMWELTALKMGTTGNIRCVIPVAAARNILL